MHDLHNDIVQTNHNVDDGICPVTDQLIEDMYFKLSIVERMQADARRRMENTAMDAYWKVLDEGGNAAAAQKAFFEIQKRFHEHN